MKRSMKTLAVLAMILSGISFLAAEEFEIIENLPGWIRGKDDPITFDPVIKASPKGSILLTAGKDKAALDLRRMLDLEPGKKYKISFMVKGENIADKRTGAFYHGGEKWQRMTRWTGTFGWTHCSFELDPAKVDGDGEVMIHFTLFGNTGKLWIDQVKITPDTVKKLHYKVWFYPVDRENNQMTISENLPMILQLLASAPAKYKEHYRHRTSRLTIDLPKYLKLMGSRSGPQSAWFSFYNLVNPVTVGATVTRDGVEYQRYFVDYPNYLALFMCVVRPHTYNFHLLFEAAPGSAGKTGKVYWSFDICGEKYPEKCFAVKVLPPVKMTEPPCQEFRLSIYKQYVVNHTSISKTGFDNLMNFWASLAKSNTYWLPDPVGHLKKNHGEKVFVELFGNDCEIRPKYINFEELEQLRKTMPTDISLKGDKHRFISAWALVDDPEGKWEKYLRNTVRKIKNHRPVIQVISWDNEPFGFGHEGCDEGGRKRFAKKMNLPEVPSIADLNGKYKKLYYDYMLKLHTELLRKGFRIMREEYPEAQLQICSGNLFARPPHYSGWACIDVREIDDLVDLHFNMPYYTGKQVFDDLQFNVKNLKKPNMPIHYPSYCRPSYTYTPPRLLQNVMAAAAVGCVGAAFGESDILSGEYMQVLARAFSMVSRAEKFYFHGQRCDNEIRITPRNAFARKLSNGRTITNPDFSQSIRYTAHKLNGKYLVTLFNYHQKEPLIAEVSGKDFPPVLVKVAPEGCEQVGTDLIPPQQPLKQAVARFTGGEAFKDHIAGKCKAVWTAAGSGRALIQLTDGKIRAGIDSIGSGDVISLQTASGREMLANGFIGRIVFNDPLQPELDWKTESYGLGKDNTPFLISTAEVGSYAGAMPDPNPQQGMKLRRKFEVRNGALLVSAEFTNPTEQEIPLQLRLNNHPWPGFRFRTKAIVLNDKYGVSIPRVLKMPDNGQDQILKAQSGKQVDEMIFRPKNRFDQIMSCLTNTENGRKTVEFVLDRKLAPGASLTVSYEVQVK